MMMLASCRLSTNFQKAASLALLLILWLAGNMRKQCQRSLCAPASFSVNKDANTNTNGNGKTGSQPSPVYSDFQHFLVHIPKSGGSYAFDALVHMLTTSPQWKKLSHSSKFMICDGRTRPVTEFETQYPYSERKHICNFWMAEQPYTSLAQHNYILTRSPHAHVVSQYFHCKESINHYDRWKYMPELNDWLQSWVDAMDNQTQAKLNRKFQCYDPRNMQARFATISNTTDLENQLLQKFQVVGDNSRMFQTICVIFIRYTQWVPHQCDCTRPTGTRNLKFHLYGHGVRHHGGSYATSPEDDQLIAKLTHIDEAFYHAAQRIFSKQLEDVQEEYGIQICES